jgi:hypothetical protein
MKRLTVILLSSVLLAAGTLSATDKAVAEGVKASHVAAEKKVDKAAVKKSRSTHKKHGHATPGAKATAPAK